MKERVQNMTPSEAAAQNGRRMWFSRQVIGGFVAREGRLPSGPEMIREARQFQGFDWLSISHLLRALQTAMARLPEVAEELV